MSLSAMTVSAVPLLLAILVARAALLRRLPKRTFVALWGVALLRLLVPAEVPFLFSVRTLTGLVRARLTAPPETPLLLPDTGFYTPVVGNMHELPPGMGTAVASSASVPPVMETPLLPVWGWVWLAGTCLLAAALLISYSRARGRFADATPVTSLYLAAWREAHPLRRPLTIALSDCAAGPLTYGILRPVILLPAAALSLPDAQLDAILTHEYIHVRRFDTLLKRLIAFALCLHWVNPLVWLMVLLAGRDIEMACDEAAVRSMGIARRKDYALTLIDMEETRGHAAPLVASFSRYATEERIQAIMKMKPINRKGTIFAILLIAMMTLLFATAAGAVDAEKPAVSPRAGTVVADIVEAVKAAPKNTTGSERAALLAEYERLLAEYHELLGLQTDGETSTYFTADGTQIVLENRPRFSVRTGEDGEYLTFQSTPALDSEQRIFDYVIENKENPDQSIRYQIVGGAVPEIEVPQGYTIRSITDEDGRIYDYSVQPGAGEPRFETIDGEEYYIGRGEGPFSSVMRINDQMTIDIGPYATLEELKAAEAEIRAALGGTIGK